MHGRPSLRLFGVAIIIVLAVGGILAVNGVIGGRVARECPASASFVSERPAWKLA
jgi:hypothetical protein